MAAETDSDAGLLDRLAGLCNRLVGRFEGPNTVGNSLRFWVLFSLGAVALALGPVLFGPYWAFQSSLFLVYAFLGLSLSVVWGYTGVLSFGQVVFFGVAGYTFGVVSVNFQTPLGITGGFAAGVLGGALMAAVLGYFMFYGGVRNVYVTIITLVSALVLHTFMAQTAGDEWTIGEAALGGFNGMPTIPNLALGVEGAALTFTDVSFYHFVLVLLLATYLGLRALVNSDYGRVMVAIREDEDRTRMFGYDVKRVKLAVFTLGGALAGVSGVLNATLNNYMSPGVFELTFASLPAIWVSVGGRKSLLGALVATLGIEYLRFSLTGELAFIIVGALLLVFILGLPGGVVPWVDETLLPWFKRTVGSRRPSAAATPAEESD